MKLPRRPRTPWGRYSAGPSRDILETASYRGDHAHRLRPIAAVPGPSSDLKLGGIVLPTNRKPEEGLPGLWLGYHLALDTGATLLVITSGPGVRRADIPNRIVRDLGAQLIVAELSDLGRSPLWAAWTDDATGLQTTGHPLSHHYRVNDVGRKRNVGLTAAALMKWETVLFLDDDISSLDGSGPTLDIDGLHNALHALNQDDDLKVVGWTLADFPDNSVYGHARRLTRQDQTVFLGGGALLVRMGRDVPFFPDIYNEDWLFLIAMAWTSGDPRRAIGVAGTVKQMQYDPFQDDRARSEEAGEIIGECLMNQQESTPWPPPPQSEAYWRECIERRAKVLRKTRRAVGRRTLDFHHYAGLRSTTSELKTVVNSALTASMSVNSQLRPADLDSYVQAWVRDLSRWQGHLNRTSTLTILNLSDDDLLSISLWELVLRQTSTPTLAPTLS